MNLFEHPIRTGLAALIMMSVAVADLHAQPLSGSSAALAISARDNEHEQRLIDLLDASLLSLSDLSRRNRRIGGYVLLGLGVGTGIGGVATLAFGDSDDARIVGISLLGGAALLGGLSLLPFKIPGEVERIHQEFSGMPEDTPDQIRQKFHYGDRRFEELAEERRRGRFIGGGASLLVGVANLAWFPSEETSRMVIFASSLVSGVTTLLVKSEEERRYETYRRAREDLRACVADPRIRFGLAPIPAGGMMGTVRIRL